MTDGAGARPEPTTPPSLPVNPGAMSEKAKERAVFLRILVYVLATHLFAGFVWLLFYLGGRRM